MSSVAVQIAEAVRVALNGETFALAFTATRGYLSKVSKDQLAAGPVVRVMIGQYQRERSDRDGESDRNIRVDILVAQSVAAPTTVATADALLGLAEAIADFLMDADIGVAGVEVQEAAYAADLPFLIEWYRNRNTIAVGVTATYRKWS